MTSKTYVKYEKNTLIVIQTRFAILLDLFELDTEPSFNYSKLNKLACLVKKKNV